MATDAETNAAGFTTPKNSDLISGGDDAISRNARAAVDLANLIKFDRGTAPNDADLNDYITPGGTSYWGSRSLNAPSGGSGTLIVTNTLTTSGAVASVNQFAIVPGIAAPELWSRFRGGNWSQWIRLDAGSVEFPEVPISMRPAAPGSIKSAPLALSTGHGGSQTTGTGTTVIVQTLPAMVERVQLHLINRNPRYQLADADPVTLSSVAIGLHNGAGSSAAWTALPGTGTTPWDSVWIDVPEAWRGKDIAVRYTWNCAGTIQRNIGTAWTRGARDGNPPLWAWLECAVPASTPVVGAFGDSLSAGVGSSRPVVDSWLSQWARTHGAFPALWAHSGDASTTWTEATDRKWFLYGMNVAAPDAMIYAMGSNEVYGGAAPDLATMQQRVRDTVRMIKAKIAPVVYGALIMPRTSYPDETLRRAVNAWYPASGLFRQVLDFGAAISADDDNITAGFDSDGVHLTTSGYAAVASSVPRSIVDWPSSEYDSGVRNVSELLNGFTGGAWLFREGRQITLRLDGASAVAGGTVEVLTFPHGFRPRSISTSAVAEGRGLLYSSVSPPTPRRWDLQESVLFVRNAVPGEALYGDVKFSTTDPEPAPGTEPGAPA